MLDVKPARDRYVGRITGPETAIIIVSIVIIRLNVNTAFSNMYNLCMKELLIVVNIVTIRLNKKETFTDMCNLCMTEFRPVGSVRKRGGRDFICVEVLM